MATISRMLNNIGLFCKRALQKRPVFCKETCIFKHPTHRSHPIATYVDIDIIHIFDIFDAFDIIDLFDIIYILDVFDTVDILYD